MRLSSFLLLLAPLTVLPAAESLRIVIHDGDTRETVVAHQQALAAFAGGPVEITEGYSSNGSGGGDVLVMTLDRPKVRPALLDLAPRLAADGLDPAGFVPQRLAPWNRDGHLEALPLYVRPMVLVWRRDVAAKLGVDPAKATTWEEFAAIGRDVRARHPDVFMTRLTTRPWTLSILLRQRGVPLADATGKPTFDTPEGAAVIAWTERQIHGPAPVGRMGNDAAAMESGSLVCFFQEDHGLENSGVIADAVDHALAVAPLPRWTVDGPRTSTAGSFSAVAIAASTTRPDAAWRVAKALAMDPAITGSVFWRQRAIPAWRPAWDQPIFHHREARFGGQALGEALIALAAEVPPVHAGEEDDRVDQALLAVGGVVERLYKANPNGDLAADLLPELHRLCGSAP